MAHLGFLRFLVPVSPPHRPVMNVVTPVVTPFVWYNHVTPLRSGVTGITRSGVTVSSDVALFVQKKQQVEREYKAR